MVHMAIGAAASIKAPAARRLTFALFNHLSPLEWNWNNVGIWFLKSWQMNWPIFSHLQIFYMMAEMKTGTKRLTLEGDVSSRIFRDLLFFPRKCPGNFFREALSSDPGAEIALGALE